MGVLCIYLCICRFVRICLCLHVFFCMKVYSITHLKENRNSMLCALCYARCVMLLMYCLCTSYLLLCKLQQLINPKCSAPFRWIILNYISYTPINAMLKKRTQEKKSRQQRQRQQLQKQISQITFQRKPMQERMHVCMYVCALLAHVISYGTLLELLSTFLPADGVRRRIR